MRSSRAPIFAMALIACPGVSTTTIVGACASMNSSGLERGSASLVREAHVNASPRCPLEVIGAHVAITRLRAEEGTEILLVGPNPELSGEAMSSWRGDINQDGHEDMLVYFMDYCGAWGECPWAIYVGCGEDRFVTAWGPEYAFHLAAPEMTRGWPDVVKVERTANAGDDHAFIETLRFAGGAYRVVAGSKSRAP